MWVWDRDLDNSIKESTKRNGGKGTKEGGRPDQGPRQLAPHFLRTPNKVESFSSHRGRLYPLPSPRKEVFATLEPCSLQWHDHSMPPCDHEEERHKNCGPLKSLERDAQMLGRTVGTDVLFILREGTFLARKNPSADIWGPSAVARTFFYTFKAIVTRGKRNPKPTSVSPASQGVI
ncbi:hypothetical protein GWK47_003302 [Chionoecetes opilio]|uniref:Uncharacterized protein n=1 Tax=Chionoecetes opilio TaxID=41210 RepID=A0A8J4YNI4_CHIOP|nr:hypothetical protein GWK47_003302 [Chionoecetes opilio]